MKAVLVFAYVIVASHSSDVIIPRPSCLPKITPMVNHVTEKAGQTFRLECSNQHPIAWQHPRATPKEAGPGFKDRLTITNMTIDHPDRQGSEFKSILEVTNISYLDTGYYGCFCRPPGDSLATVANTLVARTYLYVDDPVNLIDFPSLKSFINVPEHGTTIVPCRPTSPDVEMIFMQVHSTRNIQ